VIVKKIDLLTNFAVHRVVGYLGSMDLKIPLWSSIFEASNECSFKLMELSGEGSLFPTTREYLMKQCRELVLCPDEKQNYFGSDYDEEENGLVAIERYQGFIAEGNGVGAWNLARMNENGIQGEKDLKTVCKYFVIAWALFENEIDKRGCEIELLRLFAKYNEERDVIYSVLIEDGGVLLEKIKKEMKFSVGDEVVSEVNRILVKVVEGSQQRKEIAILIGGMYEMDASQRIFWWERAVEYGDASSAFSLGQLYNNMASRDRDACKYFSIAWSMYEDPESKQLCLGYIRCILDGIDSDESNVLSLCVREFVEARESRGVRVKGAIKMIQNLVSNVSASHQAMSELSTNLDIDMSSQIKKCQYILEKVSRELEIIYVEVKKLRSVA